MRTSESASNDGATAGRARPPWELWGLALLVAVLVGAQIFGLRQELRRALPADAADAVPLYLAAAVVREGGDPTSVSALRARLAQGDIAARPGVVSTLYPASAAVLVEPLARGSWASFVETWRDLLLAGAVLAGALGGFAAARGPAAPLAACAGAWVAIALFPTTAECVRLGQVNALLAGLLGAALAAASRGWLASAAGFATIGAAVKLVPALALWPIVAARSRRGVLAAVVVGGAVLALTLARVPADRVVAGVAATLDFQLGVRPDWLVNNPAPDWMRFLGKLRHTPLAVWTIVLGAASALLARRPSSIASGIALGSAWLGADAAGFHVLYTPLYLPALVYTAFWALDEDAPAWSWVFLLLLPVPAVLSAWELPGVVVEARLVLAGLCVWAATAARLLWEIGPLSRRAWLGLGVIALLGVAAAWRERSVAAPPRTRPVPVGVGTAPSH